MIRTTGYKFGYPHYDSRVQRRPIYQTRPHWNDVFEDWGAGEELRERLNALPFILCVSDDPMHEFELLAAEEEFLSRREIAVKYADENDPVFESFTQKDYRRDRWYTHCDPLIQERLLHNQFLSVNEAQELVDEISEDFGVALDKRAFLQTGKSYAELGKRELVGWYHIGKNALRLKVYKEGIPLNNVLHEMAHFLDYKFVHNGEPPSAKHGYRFKKIHMHLAHNYGNVPAEEILKYETLRYAYQPFKLRPEDITSRDFTERRTADARPRGAPVIPNMLNRLWGQFNKVANGEEHVRLNLTAPALALRSISLPAALAEARSLTNGLHPK